MATLSILSLKLLQAAPGNGRAFPSIQLQLLEQLSFVGVLEALKTRTDAGIRVNDAVHVHLRWVEGLMGLNAKQFTGR